MIRQLFLCLLFIIATAFTQSAKAQLYQHIYPENLNDGWEVDSLHRVGIDLEIIKETIINLGYSQGSNDFRSLIIARNGKLVVEQYLNNYRVETIHDVRSAGKTFTGTLLGIAMDKGLVGGPATKVMSIFENYTSKNPGHGKEEMTIENVLNMSSGLDADAYDSRSPGNERYLVQADNYRNFVLDLPMKFQPGKKYVYNSAAAYLAGAIVEEVSGLSLSDFTNEHLFGPLKIQQYYWTKGPNNTTFGMGGLYLTGRDFAKLGQLYLNEGHWEGYQILSKKWVKDTLQKRYEVSNPFANGYSRFWYASEREVNGKKFTCFYASGNGGNIMAIVPELELVVAIMQSCYGQGYGHFRAWSVIDQVVRACVVE